MKRLLGPLSIATYKLKNNERCYPVKVARTIEEQVANGTASCNGARKRVNHLLGPGTASGAVQFENGPVIVGASSLGRSIEMARAVENQLIGPRLGAVVSACEAVQDIFRPCPVRSGYQLEDRAPSVRSSGWGHAVEVASFVKDDSPTDRELAIRLPFEAIQNCRGPCPIRARHQFENGPESELPACLGCTVEVALVVEREPARRVNAICSRERINETLRPGAVAARAQLEDRAAGAGFRIASCIGGAVEVAFAIKDQARLGLEPVDDAGERVDDFFGLGPGSARQGYNDHCCYEHSGQGCADMFLLHKSTLLMDWFADGGTAAQLGVEVSTEANSAQSPTRQADFFAL